MATKKGATVWILIDKGDQYAHSQPVFVPDDDEIMRLRRQEEVAQEKFKLAQQAVHAISWAIYSRRKMRGAELLKAQGFQVKT